MKIGMVAHSQIHTFWVGPPPSKFLPYRKADILSSLTFSQLNRKISFYCLKDYARHYAKVFQNHKVQIVDIEQIIIKHSSANKIFSKVLLYAESSSCSPHIQRRAYCFIRDLFQLVLMSAKTGWMIDSNTTISRSTGDKKFSEILPNMKSFAVAGEVPHLQPSILYNKDKQEAPINYFLKQSNERLAKCGDFDVFFNEFNWQASLSTTVAAIELGLPENIKMQQVNHDNLGHSTASSIECYEIGIRKDFVNSHKKVRSKLVPWIADYSKDNNASDFFDGLISRKSFRSMYMESDYRVLFQILESVWSLLPLSKAKNICGKFMNRLTTRKLNSFRSSIEFWRILGNKLRNLSYTLELIVENKDYESKNRIDLNSVKRKTADSIETIINDLIKAYEDNSLNDDFELITTCIDSLTKGLDPLLNSLTRDSVNSDHRNTREEYLLYVPKREQNFSTQPERKEHNTQHNSLKVHISQHTIPDEFKLVDCLSVVKPQKGESCKLHALSSALKYAYIRHQLPIKSLPTYKSQSDEKHGLSLRFYAKRFIGSKVGEVYSVRKIEKLIRMCGFTYSSVFPKNESGYIKHIIMQLKHNKTPMVFFDIDTVSGMPVYANGNNEHASVVVAFYTHRIKGIRFILSQWGKYYDVCARSLYDSSMNLSEQRIPELFIKEKGMPWVESSRFRPTKGMSWYKYRFAAPLTSEYIPLRGCIITLNEPTQKFLNEIKKQSDNAILENNTKHKYWSLYVIKPVWDMKLCYDARCSDWNTVELKHSDTASFKKTRRSLIG